MNNKQPGGNGNPQSRATSFQTRGHDFSPANKRTCIKKIDSERLLSIKNTTKGQFDALEKKSTPPSSYLSHCGV